MSKARKLLKSSVTRPGGLALAGACMLVLGSSAKADSTLFTTQEDFTGWSGTALTLAPSATDLDANPTNGLGNTTSAGSAGTAGSLAVTWVSGTFDNNEFSQGEQGNAGFRTALGLPATGASASTVTGTIKIDYTRPNAGTGNYFQLGIVINCDSNFGQFTGTETADGGGVFTATIPFTINASALTYFQLGLLYNSNFTPNAPFNVDNIRIQNNLNPPPTPGSGSWKVPGSGTWSSGSAAEWDPNVPNGADNAATFGTYGGTITVPTTVNVSGGVTVGTLNFDNTAGYTLNGGAITIATATPATADHQVHTAINVLSGSHTINSTVTNGTNSDPLDFNVVQASSTLTIPNLAGQFYTFQKDGAGKLVVNKAQNVTLLVNGGTVQFLSSGTQANISYAYFVNVGSGATLDTTNNGFVYQYGAATGAADSFRTMLHSGYGNGNWGGTGWTSSTAAAIAANVSNIHKTAIGYVDISDPQFQNNFDVPNFTGATVDPTDVLMRYTLTGDANLDNTVDVSDFNKLAANYGTTGQYWYEGDFNYDGTVNMLDLNAIAINFGQSLPASAPALGALVPEPASIVACSFAALLLGRRSRKHQG